MTSRLVASREWPDLGGRRASRRRCRRRQRHWLRRWRRACRQLRWRRAKRGCCNLQRTVRKRALPQRPSAGRATLCSRRRCPTAAQASRQTMSLSFPPARASLSPPATMQVAATAVAAAAAASPATAAATTREALKPAAATARPPKRRQLTCLAPAMRSTALAPAWMPAAMPTVAWIAAAAMQMAAVVRRRQLQMTRTTKTGLQLTVARVATIAWTHAMASHATSVAAALARAPCTRRVGLWVPMTATAAPVAPA